MAVPPGEASAAPQAGSGEEDPSPGPAEAEPGAEPAPEAGAPAGAGGEISEDAVNSFSRAYLRVVTIEADYGPKLQAAQSQEEVESLQAEATKEMQQAVTEEGMSLDEFEKIGQQVAADEALRERVEAKLQELQTKTAP